MGTKMKGLLKGLKQFSNRFEEKEEMQIGLPTDVKHVAHIGWDGPSLESPSWMKHFKGGAAQSAPLDFSGLPVEDSEKKWVSQDSSRKKTIKSPARDLPELPKSSRRQSIDSPAASPSRGRDPSKSRGSRRHVRKESDGGGGGRTKELSNDAPDQVDIPKKTRRKKSKDSSVQRSSKSKDKDKEPSANRKSEDSLPPTSFSDPFSNPGLDNIDSTINLSRNRNEVLPASKLNPFLPDMEKVNVAVA